MTDLFAFLTWCLSGFWRCIGLLFLVGSVAHGLRGFALVRIDRRTAEREEEP